VSTLAPHPKAQYEHSLLLIQMNIQVRVIQEHDILRETQQSLLLHEDSFGAPGRYWKLKTAIKSCLAVERLDIEGRRVEETPWLRRRSETLQHPRPLYYDRGPHIFAGFRFRERNRYLDPRISKAVYYGPRRWQIGLIIRYTKPEWVKWDLKTCLVDMSTTSAFSPSI
jgi:hypothetical protein